MRADFERLTAGLRECVVEVLNGGSGVVWDTNGCIVTNAHVAQGENAEIVYASGKRTISRVILRDRKRDLVLLQPAERVSGVQAEIGDSDSLRAGQIVLAIGNPLGLTGAVTAGVIHNVGPVSGRKWIQADVRLAPGNSGGVLADANGRVIGITTMIWNGLALAVPSNEVNAFVRRLYLKKIA